MSASDTSAAGKIANIEKIANLIKNVVKFVLKRSKTTVLGLRILPCAYSVLHLYTKLGAPKLIPTETATFNTFLSIWWLWLCQCLSTEIKHRSFRSQKNLLLRLSKEICSNPWRPKRCWRTISFSWWTRLLTARRTSHLSVWHRRLASENAVIQTMVEISNGRNLPS